METLFNDYFESSSGNSKKKKKKKKPVRILWEARKQKPTECSELCYIYRGNVIFLAIDLHSHMIKKLLYAIFSVMCNN